MGTQILYEVALNKNVTTSCVPPFVQSMDLEIQAYYCGMLKITDANGSGIPTICFTPRFSEKEREL